MIGERENTFNETEYGSLVMRPYNISGNDIDAFYDANGNLIFVLDKMLSDAKPNVLLVINPDGDKKWDEILSGTYGIDLEYVRPKIDNKYQKLDIEYSGLGVYDSLLKAYVAGDGIEDNLIQLNVLRNSATRHSAMIRLNAANETITKTKATIVKTKESIVRFETRLKILREKLSDLKGEVGRIAPKQSAAKILKTESQIESTQEKIKRANKRLESAEKRLETATIDAKLASDLLNQPSFEIKQPTRNKPMIVALNNEVQSTAPDDEDAELVKPEETVELEESEDIEPKEEVAEKIEAPEKIELPEETEEVTKRIEVPEETEEVTEKIEVPNESEEVEEPEDEDTEPEEDIKEPEQDFENPKTFDEEEVSDDVVFGDDGEILDYDKEDETGDSQDVIQDNNQNSEDDTSPEQSDNQDSESGDIKPLLDKDPEIIDEDIAFKPIDFNMSGDVPEFASTRGDSDTFDVPNADKDTEEDVDNTGIGGFDNNDNEIFGGEDSEKIENVDDEKDDQPRPVLESLTPITDEPLVAEKPVIDEPEATEEIHEEKPLNLSEEKMSDIDFQDSKPDVDVFDSSDSKKHEEDFVPAPVSDDYRPASPVIMSDADVVVAEYEDSKSSGSKSSFAYFLLLLILIGLSVFALWLYQKNMGSIKPFFSFGSGNVVATETPEPVVAPEPINVKPIVPEDVPGNKIISAPAPAPEEPVVVEDTGPVVINAVSSKISSFSNTLDTGVVAEEVPDTNIDAGVDKPVYEVGEKHEEMFVYEEPTPEEVENDEEYSEPEPVVYYPAPEQRIQYSDEYFQDDDPFVDYYDDGNRGGFIENPEPDNMGDDYDNGWDETEYIYGGGMIYEGEYDAEEAAYQAGDDGYDEYR